tara:strand:- start:16302 stop:16712 length:411 start_codon:yes stop_codon:yes gene_type:complete
MLTVLADPIDPLDQTDEMVVVERSLDRTGATEDHAETVERTLLSFAVPGAPAVQSESVDTMPGLTVFTVDGTPAAQTVAGTSATDLVFTVCGAAAAQLAVTGETETDLDRPGEAEPQADDTARGKTVISRFPRRSS